MSVAAAAKPLVDTSVTYFTSTTTSVVIYVGSFLWFAFLVTMDVWSVVTRDMDNLHAMTIVGNSIMFVLQTINVLYLTFRFWPVVSLYYTAQLWVLGLRAAMVAMTEEKLFVALMLLAQCLFTSSQLSVTLEYLYRRSQPPRPARTIANRT